MHVAGRCPPAAGVVFEAHRLVYHSTLGLRVIKKKKKKASSKHHSSSTAACFYSLTITNMGEVPREQKMLKGHLPRVTHHQVYED